MIVVGVDPGARETGLVVISAGIGRLGSEQLVASLTIRRDPGGDLLEIPPAYLEDVIVAVSAAVREHDADLLAVESLRKPNAHHRGKLKPIDPAGVMATAVVWGALVGRRYYTADATAVQAVAVPPGRNGSLPLAAYPEQLRPTRGLGRGADKLRHERSAFDVARRAPAAYAVARSRR